MSCCHGREDTGLVGTQGGEAQWPSKCCCPGSQAGLRGQISTAWAALQYGTTWNAGWSGSPCPSQALLGNRVVRAMTQPSFKPPVPVWHSWAQRLLHHCQSPGCFLPASGSVIRHPRGFGNVKSDHKMCSGVSVWVSLQNHLQQHRKQIL